MGKYSKYKGVSKRVCSNSTHEKTNNSPWQALFSLKGVRWKSTWATEREAALAYDMKMIELGLPPVNILKPKIKP